MPQSRAASAQLCELHAVVTELVVEELHAARSHISQGAQTRMQARAIRGEHQLRTGHMNFKSFPHLHPHHPCSAQMGV